ncbi:hypothetical protein EYZ11_009999 [Aspergillus tanneri]|nr:hypothetical protein EYZ11_009999 [Aspergillus tanneri]
MLFDLVDASHYLDIFPLLGVLLLSALTLFYTPLTRPQLPLVNDKKPFELQYANAKKRFVTDARNLIKNGLTKTSAFRIVTENGNKIVLSPKYANEIRNIEELSFNAAIASDFHGNIRGFNVFKERTASSNVFLDAVRMKLTSSLGKITEPLSMETADALQVNWTNNRDWHHLAIRPSILRIVAQLSSKVFLGDKICRNPDWLRITIDYTVDSVLAAEELRLWPAPVRPVVSWFLPSCRKVRNDMAEAYSIIRPVLEERRRNKEMAIQQGRTPDHYNDAMEWMEECAKGRPYDAATAQMSFSFAAIHTTSDLITQVLYDIAGKEDLIQELREEVITTIGEGGWKRTTLYKLRLMDSVIKESQRMKPIGIASMRRQAKAAIQLSDGTRIAKGDILVVSCEWMWDPNFYTHPDTFDPYRFLKLRDSPGRETSSQLVSPSPEHMGFGYGKHACPGRFFAVNEIKIALCHVLLKYDFKLAQGFTPQPRKSGASLSADPNGSIAVRRREEEISLDL